MGILSGWRLSGRIGLAYAGMNRVASGGLINWVSHLTSSACARRHSEVCPASPMEKLPNVAPSFGKGSSHSPPVIRERRPVA